MFSAGGRGGRFHPELAPAAGDTVASEHETSRGFTGTDLDDRLRERGIEDVVLAGALSNTASRRPVAPHRTWATASRSSPTP
jgi:nicotinamidase-related amidase